MKHVRSAMAGAPVCLTTILLESDLGSLVPVPDGVTASFAVYDRKNQEFTAVRDPHAQFRTASVVKRAGSR